MVCSEVVGPLRLLDGVKSEERCKSMKEGEEIRAVLLEKMFSELTARKNNLLALSSEEIISSSISYELTYKEEFIEYVGDSSAISLEECEFLLLLDEPLEWLFRQWLASDVSDKKVVTSFIKSSVGLDKTVTKVLKDDTDLKMADVYIAGDELGLGGYCSFVYLPGCHDYPLSFKGSVKGKVTSSRMELTALIQALSSPVFEEPCHIQIHTTCGYIASAIEKGWAKSWRSKGWKKSDGKPAANADLWETVLDLLEKHTVDMLWTEDLEASKTLKKCHDTAVEIVVGAVI